MRHFFLTGMCALVLVGCKSSYEKGFDSGYGDGYAQTYQNAFDEGYADGHDEGQVAGHEDGYNAGHADGYTQGYGQSRDDFASADYLSGYDDGNAQGYSDGYDTGHADGMVNGGVDGYADGATDGYNDGYGYGHSDYYNDGYDDGWDDGRSNGYSDGSYDGASDGYHDGYDDEYDWAYDSNYGDGYDDGYDDGYGDGYYGFSFKSHSPMAKLARQVNSDLINYSSLKKFDSASTLERGSIVYSGDAGSVDIEKLAALKERHYLNQMSSQLSARFGLSFESAGRIATIAHQFNRLAGSRVLTDEDASAFSKELIGFDMGEIKNAVKNSMKGESQDLNKLLEEASGKVGVTPEKMNRMISELFY